MKLGIGILFIILLFTLTACSKYGPQQVKAWDLVNKGALLIDVRTKEEFKESHLPNAINIDYENVAKIAKAIGQDKNRSVVLYCHSGRRASIALKELNKLGYNNIYNGQALTKMQAALEDKKNSQEK